MSRTMARATTMPAPADSPCTPLKNTSCPMLCDNAQPADANVKIATPHSTTGLRPTLSDKAP